MSSDGYTTGPCILVQIMILFAICKFPPCWEQNFGQLLDKWSGELISSEVDSPQSIDLDTAIVIALALGQAGQHALPSFLARKSRPLSIIRFVQQQQGSMQGSLEASTYHVR